ncbi:hypothetical protein DVH24_028234 [Malus domestica]|uniref:Terpene synthase N-terminal domain-containing protein n=1 Tax=Malus domestica TaxID=3750 RepID=A0A498HFI2_MALDO|nr:hypothetical protein DVH24_028234 [Malus domestica]
MQLYDTRWWKFLEEKVKHMIDYGDDDINMLTMFEFIDDIRRLSLGYHFEEDITRTPYKILNNIDGQGIDQSLPSLLSASCSLDIWMYSVDSQTDVKGMISLCKVPYFSFEGESLLDEGLAFSTIYLKNLSGANVSKGLAEQVSHALELPLHRIMQRLEARWYIEPLVQKIVCATVVPSSHKVKKHCLKISPTKPSSRANCRAKAVKAGLLGLMHQATGYRLGEVVGRSKVEQDQVLALGFRGRTSVRPVRSYSYSCYGPKTGLQSWLLELLLQPPRLIVGPQADLLGLPLPPGHIVKGQMQNRCYLKLRQRNFNRVRWDLQEVSW